LRPRNTRSLVSSSATNRGPPSWAFPYAWLQSPTVDDADLGPRLIELLGEPACCELLDVLQRPEADRAALIGRLYQREDAQAIAEILLDVESDPDDLVRLRLIGALEAVLGT
jgi:hypothetical protein